MKKTETKYTHIAKLRVLEGHMAFHLECFGDQIAAREKYKEHKGIEAIHFYLIQKYHWLPSQVKALNWEDLSFLLAEERSGWTLPKEAIVADREADEPSD